ncbi:hypothetical protein [Mucilaginibacter ginkgonis]|uniref:Uncharacterized protein n=1 Tax=Mucilaginibacter ginkgonis TaxID=2682091 RepID=A0A6I4I0Q1_9SPHI|nr:hypothetical protein [Mucilaginibacter ginkgonis]QQL48409.1 hypothetical protein GO620_009400 [Mucilaginibacter ginkgonis]
MKFKLTPLNFCTAAFLFIAVYVWIYGGATVASSGVYNHLSAAIGWIFLLFAVVVSFLDIIFRNYFKELKNVWWVELSFITLTAIIFLLVK